MSRLRYNRSQAVDYLRKRCQRLRQVIDRIGPLKLRVSDERDLFSALARSVVYQQLSGKAAATIHARFAELFAGGGPRADECLELGYTPLRGAGLSNNKALALLDLAEKVSSRSPPPIGRMHRKDDAALIDNLCQVRGVGPWTAQMFLIFNLGRPDVMPATDLGVQKGVQAVYRLPGLPDPAEVLQRTRHLAPYRSAASWYFWQAADTQLPG
jgi:3-methyladenine DNA glycosylase/8-oxoguanine DNA glycosylase